MTSEAEINSRIEALAENLMQKKLAFSMSQARERAREIVLQEVKMQEGFEKIKDDPAHNPQQRVQHVAVEDLKKHGLLTGSELPQDIPLAELLKGRREQK